MTRKTIARLAGFTFLFYIAVGVAQMDLFGGATAGEGSAAKLANMAQHATDVRVNVVLVVGLPLQVAGVLRSPVTMLM